MKLKLRIEPERFPWLCAAAGALAFLFALPGKLFWDSEVLITGNLYLRSFDYLPKLWTTSVMAGGGVPTNYYRPVSTTVLLVAYQLWGAHPFGYHALNVGLHALNAALVYFAAEKLMGDKRSAAWAALFFAIHPLQSEQVNYPDHIEGLLALSFGMGAVLSWLRGASPVATAVFYALSLLSKEEGAVFGPILGLLWLTRPKAQRDWKSLAPAAAVAAVYVVLRMTVLDFLDLPGLEVGAQAGAYASLPLRLLTFAKSLMLYARLLVAPFGLHFDRGLPPATWGDPWAWASVAGCVVLFGGLWKLSDAKGRAGWLWFFAAMLPYCGLVPFNNVAAEHFLYIPSVGLAIALVPLLSKAAARLPKHAAGYALGAAVVACLLLDARRSIQWQDPETIYATTLAGNPESFRAAANLGVERFRKGELDRARVLFRRALEIKPDYAVALNNLGAVAEANDQLDRAMALYTKALEAQPGYVLARKNLAGAYVGLGMNDEAIAQCKEALKTHPDYDGAWKMLGFAYFKKGDLTAAQAAMRRGLEINPDPLTLKRLSAIEDAVAQLELRHRRAENERRDRGLHP